jgi:prolipoprotein diacylglyceryltransferase
MLLAVTLVKYLRLSLWVMLAIVLVALLTLFALTMITKIIAGKEKIIYYHHEIAVMCVTAILLWMLRQPILPYLDVTILGIGVFLFCGRIGCFMVGCCHGRPYGRGVCYRKEHAEAGFTPYYVGVPLFPIQLVESLWVFSVVVAGVALVLRYRNPGEAVAWYVIMYDTGRLCFEFMRGDPDRSYCLGFSQQQWISLILMLVIVWLGLLGILPFHTWHVVVTSLAALIMIGVAISRQFRRVSTYRILNPRHVKEVAEALALASGEVAEGDTTLGIKPVPANIHVSCTSLGIQISSNRIKDAGVEIHHYALSMKNNKMTEQTAKVLVKLIRMLEHPDSSEELLKGSQSVFHVLI